MGRTHMLHHRVCRQVKDLRQKMGALKQSQQTGKSQNLQMLEEGRLREEALNSDSSQLKVPRRNPFSTL